MLSTLALLLAAAPVCSYSHDIALEQGTLNLPNGEVFAKLTKSPVMPVEVQFPPGEVTRGAPIHFTTGDVSIDAHYVALRGFRLDLREARKESPVLLAPAGSEVFWSGSNGKKLVVIAQRSYGLEPKAPSTFAMNCNQLTIENVEIAYEDVDQPPAEGAPYFYATISTPHTPVSAKPGSTPEEYITQSESPLLVLGQLRGFAHVRGWFGEAMLDGWVPSGAIHRTSDDDSDIFKTECPSAPPKGGTPCADEVPLSLRVGDKVVPLGKLQQNALITFTKPGDEWTVIELPALNWLKLTAGAEFVIDHDSVTACTGKR